MALLSARPRTAAGFTLAELLVSLLVTTLVLGSVIFLFQVHGSLVRTQTQVAEMQQSLRVAAFDLVRYARMTGRGGLPVGLAPRGTAFGGRLLPNGVALEVATNVPESTRVGGAAGPPVVAGSDLLTLRGVFESPIYQVDPAAVRLGPGGGTAVVHLLGPAGLEQDLEPLKQAVQRAATDPEALLLVSPLAAGVYAVGELTGGGWVAAADGRVVRATLELRFTGGSRTGAYRNLMEGASGPAALRSAAFLGILEEHRYYLRADRAIPGDDTSELLPRLSRARFYPGTDVAHPSTPSLREDVADQVWDFQVAIGVDSDDDGVVAEGVGSGRADDEWLFNHPGDVLDDASSPASWVWNGTADSRRPLLYLRISTLVRSDRRHLEHLSEAIAAIEDRIYGEDAVPGEADRAKRGYRRRLLTMTVELRNL
ncbi:MAG: hypothetical protein R3325_04895 [Thermoanaerobaculia bacterium]|nr:hypothetical protein [Thermoanaerobaculia bacterium]